MSSVQIKFRLELRWEHPDDLAQKQSRTSWISKCLKSIFRFGGKDPSRRVTEEVVMGRDKEGNRVIDVSVIEDTDHTASSSTTNAPPDEIILVEEPLKMPVEASIQIWVEGNIPLRSPKAQAWLQSPVRRLFPSIGPLVAGTVVRSLAPALGDLLVRDYLKRQALEKAA